MCAKSRFKLRENANGSPHAFRRLAGETKVSPFVAPAEDSTVALLAEKGISYETKIEDQDYPRFNMTYAGWFVASSC